MDDKEFIFGYLKRIGYSGTCEPTLQTLNALLNHHACTVPFENLDILRGLPVRLEEDALYNKVVVQRRGGVCFELNRAFFLLLSKMGFPVSQHMASVGDHNCMGEHILSIVDLPEGSYLADVAFADCAVPPVLISSMSRTPGYGREFWVEEEGDSWRLMHGCEGELAKLAYTFRKEPCSQSDYAEQFRKITAPDNPIFATKPICCIQTDAGRQTLIGRNLTLSNGFAVVTNELDEYADLQPFMKECFGITAFYAM